MHELSLAAAIADIVDRHACGRRVIRVEVAIGHLRQAVPAALSFGFELVSTGTTLEGAKLDIRQVPVRGLVPRLRPGSRARDRGRSPVPPARASSSRSPAARSCASRRSRSRTARTARPPSCLRRTRWTRRRRSSLGWSRSTRSRARDSLETLRYSGTGGGHARLHGAIRLLREGGGPMSTRDRERVWYLLLSEPPIRWWSTISCSREAPRSTHPPDAATARLGARRARWGAPRAGC